MSKIFVTPYPNKNEKSDQFGYWYFRAFLSPTITDDELIQHIASDSKVERTKVFTIHSAIKKQIVELLCNGHQLEIPHLGKLKLSVNSKGTQTAEEYNAGTCIRKVRIILTPNQEIKDALKKVKYQKKFVKTKDVTPDPPTP